MAVVDPVSIDTVSPVIKPASVKPFEAISAVVLPSYTLLLAVKLPAIVNSFGVISAVVVGALVKLIV